MEIAGIALGVAGLAGIIGSFRDVIELLDMFAASKKRVQQREAIMMMTKFDIERFLLLKWAEDVRLIMPNYDKRLDDPTTRSLVAQVLACIQRLFKDSDTLRDRYGVQDTVPSSSELLSIRSNWRISSTGLDEFHKDFKKFQAHLTETAPARSTVQARLRWVIRDKSMFNDLVRELGSFIGKLRDILPPILPRTNHTIHHGCLESIDDPVLLRFLLQASKGTHDDMAGEAVDRLRKMKILDTLWFRQIDERKDLIEPAHIQTLEWVLNPPSEDFIWDDLTRWLRQGSGTYWVTGKAGSGKSTLMKFVCDNDITKDLLGQWGGGKPCYLASYFFWALGSQQHHTLQGLARSLIHQLLSSRRDLIPQAFPSIWKEQAISDVDNVGLRKTPSLPSLAEMKRAFDFIVTQLNKSGEKACLLIDGLDEFIGTSQRDVIDFIRPLTSGPSVKVLLSSRPIPECVAAFQTSPKLRLEDLNGQDISNYVSNIIAAHPYMQKMMERSLEETKGLIADIKSRSSGVFLWVILACRSLTIGFDDFDKISELRERVDQLPQELEDMFQHMLNRVVVRHRIQAARLLTMCFLRQRRNLYQDQEQNSRLHNNMYALELALISDYDTELVSFRTLNMDERRENCQTLEGRLRSRTAGLLELRIRGQKGDMSWTGDHCFCGRWSDHDPWIDGRVEFLHRTVFDFLCQDHVWTLDCLAVPDKLFSAATALSLGGLHLAIQSISPERPAQIVSHLFEGMAWGAKADTEKPYFRDNIFWNTRPFFELLVTGDHQALVSSGPLNRLVQCHRHQMTGRHSHAVLQLGILGGAVNYVRLHPNTSELAVQALPRCGCAPLLTYTGVMQMQSLDLKLPALAVYSLSMVAFLLSVGCPPNAWIAPENNVDDYETTMSETPWRAWMRSRPLYPQRPDLLAALNLTVQFITAGASIDTTIKAELQVDLESLSEHVSSDIRVEAILLLSMVRNS